MDPHRLAEERSLAYHAAIAERLRAGLSSLEKARKRLEEWGNASIWREVRDAAIERSVERGFAQAESGQARPAEEIKAWLERK